MDMVKETLKVVETNEAVFKEFREDINGKLLNFKNQLNRTSEMLHTQYQLLLTNLIGQSQIGGGISDMEIISEENLKIEELDPRKINLKRTSSTLFTDDFSKEVVGIIEPLCYGCYDKKSETVAYPCLHTGLCEKCSKKIYCIKKICSHCRRDIDFIEVYQERNDGYYVIRRIS